ncbi:Integral membrane HPP family protein [Trifolium repens]|nr:Integral membrane HPP family protein [Trifolium repens]
MSSSVSAILLATPQAPSAQKYNMLMAQIGCAAIGVLAFTLFGPGWLAKGASVAACVAYMIYTDTIHPPARSRMHSTLFHSRGCSIYMKKNFKF